MEKTLEICRSFSWTVQVEQFAPRNFFCSEKMECLESEAEETSKKLFHFCRMMVEKDVKEYIESNKPESEKVIQLDQEPITEQDELTRSKFF